MAGELLASLDDINSFLSSDKAVADSVDDQMQIDAARVIKSKLAGVFQPTTIAGWNSPDNTPATIRAIAGRLIAGRWYAKQITGTTDNKIPAYAQSLFDEALGMLVAIRTGTLTVVDSDGTPITDPDLLDLGENDYYPNLSAPGPMFAVEQKWG